MKKILLFISSICTVCTFAQKPLLPLLENATIKWGVSGHYKGTLCDQNGANIKRTNQEILKDTLIGLKVFKIINTTTEICFDRYRCGNIPGQFCSTYKKKLILIQEGNLIKEVDDKGSLIDTLLFMDSTFNGVKVVVRGHQKFSIISIDSVLIENSKVRRFNFGSFQSYIDGIGFDADGLFFNNGSHQAAEAGSILTCYEKNGISYQVNRVDGQNSEISNLSKTSTSCLIILGTNDEIISQNFHTIFVNSQNELETSDVAVNLEITDLYGNLLLARTNVSKTNLNHLPNGPYLANLKFSNSQRRFKFILNK